MKTRSAKNKGRRLQNLIRDKILELFPKLTSDDVRSTAMGQSGMDIQLSPAAQKAFPFAIECKNNKKFVGYTYMKQAEGNAEKLTPIVVVKADRKKPVVIIDLDIFLGLVR